MEPENQLNKTEFSIEEGPLLLKISRLALLIAYLGFAYAIIITATTLYSIFSVADNSATWRYYQTIPGFINILVVICSGLLYWYMSWLMYQFSKKLQLSVNTSKQEYFDMSWRHFNRLLLLLLVLLLLFIGANIFSSMKDVL